MGARPSASESEELEESSESSSEELESPGRWESESETTSSRESELQSPKATRHPASVTKESSEQLSPPYRSPEVQQQEDTLAQSPGARTGPGPEVPVSLGDPEGRGTPGSNDGTGGTQLLLCWEFTTQPEVAGPTWWPAGLLWSVLVCTGSCAGLCWSVLLWHQSYWVRS